MLLSGRNAKELAKLIRKLWLEFVMYDLGPTHHILAIKITRHFAKKQLFLFQADYIQRIFGVIQHAIGPICFDPTTCQLSVVSESLSDILFEGGSHEVSIVRTSCWLFDVLYVRNMTKHSACGRSRKQIYAQPQRTTLECSEAYPQIHCWHKSLIYWLKHD